LGEILTTSQLPLFPFLPSGSTSRQEHPAILATVVAADAAIHNDSSADDQHYDNDDAQTDDIEPLGILDQGPRRVVRRAFV